MKRINMRTIQRDIVGAFIFSADNKLLLGKSIDGGVYPDSWIVPGGGVEPDETMADAIKREILEETGIDISGAVIEEMNGVLSGESEKVLRDTNERALVEMKFYNFKVTLLKKSTDIILAHDDDFVQSKWFTANELKKIKLSPPTMASLKKLGLI